VQISIVYFKIIFDLCSTLIGSKIGCIYVSVAPFNGAPQTFGEVVPNYPPGSASGDWQGTATMILRFLSTWMCITYISLK